MKRLPFLLTFFLLSSNAGAERPGVASSNAASLSVEGTPSSTEQEQAESPIARDASRRLYIEASQLAAKEEWEAALRLYGESFRAYPAASTLYNLGYCQARLGRPVAALVAIEDALKLSSDDGVELADERRAQARDQLSAVQQEVAVLEVEFRAEAELVDIDRQPLAQLDETDDRWMKLEDSFVLRKGARVQGNAGTHLRVLLKPGQHELTLLVAGIERRSTFELNAGERLRWLIDGGPPVVPTQVVEPPPVAARGDEDHARSSGRPKESSQVLDERSARASVHVERPYRWAALGGFGVSLAALGTAVGTGIARGTARENLEAACPQGVCPQSAEDELKRYGRMTTATNLALWTSVGALGAGVTFFVLDRASLEVDAVSRSVSWRQEF